jgi:NAD dependent epimerase/dehydratase family enzyme
MRLLFIGGTGIIGTVRMALAAEHGMDVTLLTRGKASSQSEDFVNDTTRPGAGAEVPARIF